MIRPTSLVISSRRAVRIFLDGEPMGEVAANAPRKFPLQSGRDLIVRALDKHSDHLVWTDKVRAPTGDTTAYEVPFGKGHKATVALPHRGDFRTVNIMGKEWFAEDIRDDNGGHWAPSGDHRLYIYANAAGGLVQKGWRLPTVEDFRHLASVYDDPGRDLGPGGISGFERALTGTAVGHTGVLSGRGAYGAMWAEGVKLFKVGPGVAEFADGEDHSHFFASVRYVRDKIIH